MNTETDLTQLSFEALRDSYLHHHASPSRRRQLIHRHDHFGSYAYIGQLRQELLRRILSDSEWLEKVYAWLDDEDYGFILAGVELLSLLNTTRAMKTIAHTLRKEPFGRLASNYFAACLEQMALPEAKETALRWYQKENVTTQERFTAYYGAIGRQMKFPEPEKRLNLLCSKKGVSLNQLRGSVGIWLAMFVDMSHKGTPFDPDEELPEKVWNEIQNMLTQTSFL
jgi:hypothetical protein